MSLSLCLCLFLGLSVCVYGWDEFSFIGNPVEDVISFYDLPLVSSYSLDDGISSFALDNTSSVSSALLQNLSPSFNPMFIAYNEYYFPRTDYFPAFYGWYSQPSVRLSNLLTLKFSTGFGYFYDWSFTPPSQSNGDYRRTVYGYFQPYSYDAGGTISPPAEEQNGYLDVFFDISSLGSFSSFELDGGVVFWQYTRGREFTSYARLYQILVDGAVVASFYPSSRSGIFSDDANLYAYFNHFIYDGTRPVTSITLRCYPGLTSVSSNSISSLGGNIGISFADARITTIVDDEIFLGNVDDAQNNINQYESDSSQWIGSMSSNFAQLSLSSFSFPTNLTGAAALLTGIFNDIWVAMGDYKIIYVFPLFLGIVLVLIGRIAKYAAAGHSHGYGADKGADG